MSEQSIDLQPGFFMRAETWLDEDGRHVWLRHHCATAIEETMLPWPAWAVREDGKVVPSINCGDCGLHVFAEVNQ